MLSNNDFFDKSEFKKTQKKIELNEKLSNYINYENRVKDKKFDIKKVKFKTLSKNY